MKKRIQRISLLFIIAFFLVASGEAQKAASVPPAGTGTAPLNPRPLSQNPLRIALLRWYNANQQTSFAVGSQPYGVSPDSRLEGGTVNIPGLLQRMAFVTAMASAMPALLSAQDPGSGTGANVQPGKINGIRYDYFAYVVTQNDNLYAINGTPPTGTGHACSPVQSLSFLTTGALPPSDCSPEIKSQNPANPQIANARAR